MENNSIERTMMKLNKLHEYAFPADSKMLKNLNRKNLNNITKYLSRLRKAEKINDREFSFLVSIACANFVENEVDLRVREIFTKKAFQIIYSV